MRKIFIGTSGWMYKHWGEKFYPNDLKKDFLSFYSNEFKTVEINSSFYRMPNEKTFKIWNQSTPKDFFFAVKLNRYITHRKRLILDEESKIFLERFLKNSNMLEKKLAAILIQLPPSFKIKANRLEEFLKFYNSKLKEEKIKTTTALEFRHPSWLNEDIFKILKKYRISLVIAGFPEIGNEAFTTNSVYIRMHGDALHQSNYRNKDLRKLKETISKYPDSIKKVFVYFNNDYSAYAIDNARYLKKLCLTK